MLIIDEELVAIDQAVDELVASLIIEPEFLAYQAAAQAVEEDAGLSKQLQLLAEEEAHIAFRPELKKLQKELIMNEKVYQLRVAENELQALLSEVAGELSGAISKEIMIDENLPLAKGGRHGRHGYAGH